MGAAPMRTSGAERAMIMMRQLDMANNNVILFLGRSAIGGQHLTMVGRASSIPFRPVHGLLYTKTIRVSCQGDRLKITPNYSNNVRSLLNIDSNSGKSLRSSEKYEVAGEIQNMITKDDVDQ